MKKVIQISLLLLFLCHNSMADMYYDYIEYRYQPKLGKITILSSFVRNVKYVDYVKDNWEELARDNIFIHATHHTDEKRVFKRSNRIGRYNIDTVLTLYPPKGFGAGGALPITYLQVTIDGKKKIDCNIGDFPGGMEEVEQIMICPEENAIYIKAFDHYQDKNICESVIFIDGTELITNTYIKGE